MKTHALILVAIFSLFLFPDSTIKFEKEVIDFGEIESGKSVTVKFKFMNSGDKVLKIEKIQSSCGCMVPKLDKREFQPEEQGVIPVTFNGAGYHGRITKVVMLTTNDPQSQHIRLKITGNVILKNAPVPILDPDTVDFGKVSLNKTYSRQLHLSNKGQKELKLFEIIHSPEVNVVFKEKRISSKQSIEFEVVFRPMERGYFRNTVRIRTNHQLQPFIYLHIKAEIQK